MQLFGGALSVQLGASFLDVSAFRQVPDNQEVFVDRVSDQSVIVELLESSNHENPAEFHFGVLAEDNEASQFVHLPATRVSSMLPSPLWNDRERHLQASTHDAHAKISITMGLQKVAKFHLDAFHQDWVGLGVLVLTLPSKSTDIVCSVNVPLPKSSGPIGDCNPSEDQLASLWTQHPSFQALMLRVLESMQVLDISIFS